MIRRAPIPQASPWRRGASSLDGKIAQFGQAKVRHPGGRPSLYRPEYAEQARRLCMLGATDAEMADFFGVGISTLKRWKEAGHPEFRTALKEGKLYADANVARSLYRSGCGYSHEAVKIFLYEGSPVAVPYVEHHPPNATSAIFWLKNRRPDLWRDRRDVELTGKDGGPVRVQAIESVVIDAEYTDITEDGPTVDGPRRLTVETEVV